MQEGHSWCCTFGDFLVGLVGGVWEPVCPGAFTGLLTAGGKMILGLSP